MDNFHVRKTEDSGWIDGRNKKNKTKMAGHTLDGHRGLNAKQAKHMHDLHEPKI